MDITVGTRGSNLALYQANLVVQKLNLLGYKAKTKVIKSEGDTDTTTPIRQFGGAGVFTNALNQAILNKEIDCAVHSCKDLPALLEDGLQITAVLERGDPYDALVAKNGFDFLQREEPVTIIATGSIRRRSQWLSKYPKHQFEELRGNIETRLKKLVESDFDGLIMANIALQRLHIHPKYKLVLNEFVPSPCQAIIAIVSHKKNEALNVILKKLNHPLTFAQMLAERSFLKELSAGCYVPVAGIAKYLKGKLHFTGELFSKNGQTKISVEKTDDPSLAENIGREAGIDIKTKGRQILDEYQT